MAETFSKRHNLRPDAQDITIWNDAPKGFRVAVLCAAREEGDLRPRALRDIICRILREQPDSSNWSDYPNVWNEVEGLLYGCEWFHVYDFVEAIADQLKRSPRQAEFDAFGQEINDRLIEMGIGWQLKDGQVRSRGEDSYEAIVSQTQEMLDEARLPTAQSELTEAIWDLSRRPEPDVSGAMQHAIASLECVLRQVTGQPKSTLGQILTSPKNPVPKPLDDAVKYVWGYASTHARHGREDRNISRPEAQLIVGLSSAVSMYVIQKFDGLF